jgi:mono/diheme cytochrome c family protein
VKRFPMTCALTVSAGLALSMPALAADARKGERLARQWCANCHVVDGTGPSTTLPQGPPSFRTAAGHLNPGELHSFLTHPHGQMPDLSLTRTEIDDLTAYIKALR